MIRVRHRYALMFLREDGSFITQCAIEPDWEPVFEAGRFRAARHGYVAPADLVDGAITPRWDLRRGAPYVSALEVELAIPGPPWTCELPITCFRETAHARASALIEDGRLAEGETYRYVPVAFEQAEPEPETHSGPSVEELPPHLPVREVALAARLAETRPAGTTHAGDLPVIVPVELLEEISVLTREAGENETGGILLGQLLRDSGSPELAVEITAQIPARAAEGSRSRLRFTAETWDDVSRAIALRRGDETWLGTWHSHPARAWCKDCAPERRATCPMQRGFFSEHDRLLHRVFPRAYSVALVATDADAGVRHSMFGWRDGLIEPRGFHLAGAGACAPLTEIPVPTRPGGPDACHDPAAG
jgi:hypothetical protein